MNQTSGQIIEIWEHITRADVRSNKDKIFLFGDNLTERGFGGQAKEMRGEENSRGIPTKKEPNNNPASFFTDKEFAENKLAIDKAFGKIPNGKTLVIPQAGLGTGLTRLSEKAPQTYSYLNEKLAEIGFENSYIKSETITKNTNQTGKQERFSEANENKAVIYSTEIKSQTAKRLLDLDNIQTATLRLLSPTEKEVEALKIDRKNALADYADRLRGDYKTNQENLRDGFRLLSDSIDKGEQITVTCSCRNGEICHADVVKMAVEKVNLHIKNRQIQEANKSHQSIEQTSFKNEIKNNAHTQQVKTNPRTRRAINEILAFSENDRALEKINQTDGRNRSEQASYLGKISPFIRDIYERGGNVMDGNLIVPQEKLEASEPLAITTQNYAVDRIGKILKDESKAKEIAPDVVEYGNKIAGKGADGETKLKVFNWIFESLEGKTDFLVKDDETQLSKSQNFENTLEKISLLAEEMYSLEPTDKLEFVPLAGFEQIEQHDESLDQSGENLNLEAIYEAAITREENEKQESFSNEQTSELETDAKINTERFERIELSGNVPQLPEEFTDLEINRLLTETLPEIDRQLESGLSQKEILAPFNKIVWQSVKDDALNQLEKIYQKQQISELDAKLSSHNLTSEQKEKLELEKSSWKAAVLTPTQEEIREILLDSREKSNIDQTKSAKAETIAQLGGKPFEPSQSIKTQLDNIDLRRHNIIELKSPGEYKTAEQAAIKTFFQTSKQEIGSRLEKIDETREKSENSFEKQTENSLKKEIRQIKESKPSFAFKLENSSEIVAGQPSIKTIQERNFVSSYINFQLKQPESRLRHESERYRQNALKLENAANRDELINAASEIRAENAAIGFKWKDSGKSDKENQPRPLTNKEMQFLFTENSPTHYTQEMTATKLSFAHSGASRRQMTESLVKGEAKPSPEASKLINSLESRLERRDLENAISATKHFFESLKTPNEQLKYKNDFDHREIYRKLPPQEKDVVYHKATQQKENLEYRLAFSQNQIIKTSELSRAESPKTETSRTEKSFYLLSQFHQARVLGEKIGSSAFTQNEISNRDASAALVLLKNQTPEKTALIAGVLRQSENLKSKKIGEVLETFGKAEIVKDENKTTINITLPESRLIKVDTYRELLEKFHPNDERENDKYKFSSFGEKTLAWAREKGQNETVKNFREEISNNIYQTNAPANVFSIEQVITEKFDEIKQFQRDARIARRENIQILEKYSRRGAAKIQSREPSVVNSKEQQEIALIALGGKSSNSLSNLTNNKFFQAVQNEITVSDFQKFTANEKVLSETKANIKNEFTEITREKDVLKNIKFKTSDLHEKAANLQQTYQSVQQAEENRLLTESARKSFKEVATIDNKTIGDLTEKSGKDAIRLESFTKARITLEPGLKSADEKEYNEQALKMADAIEKAHDLSKQNAPKAEIAQAFEATETEKTVLNEIGGIKISEDKPLSLQLYENEIGRAEKQLFAKSLSEKLAENKNFLAEGKLPNLETLFPPQEREQIKLQAAEIAKERLEPKELDADHRKISPEVSRQALMTIKQLEQASNTYQTSQDKSKINESFLKLDSEAKQLNQIRGDYNRTEKLELLRDGIKTDIADLIKKNPSLKESDFLKQSVSVLKQNLEKVGILSIAGDKHRINTLSLEINKKIEAKQKPSAKENAVFNYDQKHSGQSQTSQRGGESNIKLPAKDKIRESLFYSR